MAPTHCSPTRTTGEGEVGLVVPARRRHECVKNSSPKSCSMASKATTHSCTSGPVFRRPCRRAGFDNGKTMWRTSNLCHVLLAVVAVLLNPRGSDANTPTTPPSPEQGESTNNSTLAEPQLTVSRLPFLEKGGGADGVHQLRPTNPHWVRVLSAKATHPAMYVPGDGLVYCPIAKASTSNPAVN